MESIWRKQIGEIDSRDQSRELYSAKSHWDVIVIGAGLAGLLTAYYLKEAGLDVLVLEANRVTSGQTERTTAKITSQHGLKYSKLIKEIGVNRARLYAQANESAIREYERLIRTQGIDCEFERTSAYLYSEQEESPLKEEAKVAAGLGIDAFFTKDTELPFPVAGAVCFRNQAQFSPLKFVEHISRELEIREHVQVTGIKGNRVLTIDKVQSTERELTAERKLTAEKELTADKIVVTTHYPIKDIPGFYFLRQHQERSYVLALSGCKAIKGMYYGMDGESLSFRQAGEYLLLGGGSRRTGENTCGRAYDFLEQAAKKYYPDCREAARWAAQDCMPHDGIPFIGTYSVFTPDLYVATGFQKWGMTTSMVAAMLLRDALLGRENPYSELFSPQRMYFRAGIKNFMVDVGVSIKGLSKGLFGRPRCSHLGCALVWNPEEKSWDCPCHGSRFDGEGKVCDNPAGKDVKI